LRQIIEDGVDQQKRVKWPGVLMMEKVEVKWNIHDIIA
jgi:hypothetical protein